MDPHLFNLVACPACQGDLYYNQSKQELICRFDRLAYPIREDIPILFPEVARVLTLEEYETLFK
jgi:uncharacterized protein YbaR (Trm112 family)